VKGLVPLARHLRGRQPDTIISTANNTALVTVIAAVFAGAHKAKIALKTTNPIASSRHRGLVRVLRSWSYRAIFRRVDAVWTLTPAESAEMRREFPAHAKLFHEVAQPYVSKAMLCAGEEDDCGDKLVVSIARLTRQKRLDRLIAGFAHVKTEGAQLVILGEGEDRATLERQVESLGLGEKISLPGYVKDVASALKRAKLSILTSDYEGFPAALLESMAANCAVASTDCFPGAQDLLKPLEGGWLIDDVSPEALGKLIDVVLTRPRPRTLRRAAERYSITSGIASHVAALENLMVASRN
jgi:glycosyltransferase involved in cell wall biosynthesis